MQYIFSYLYITINEKKINQKDNNRLWQLPVLSTDLPVCCTFINYHKYSEYKLPQYTKVVLRMKHPYLSQHMVTQDIFYLCKLTNITIVSNRFPCLKCYYGFRLLSILEISKMRICCWPANSIEPGQTVWMCRLVQLYSGSKVELLLVPAG